MKARIIEDKEVEEVLTDWANIKHKSRYDSLVIETDNFDLTVKKTGFHLTYRIKRPSHDHDNYPDIYFEIPEEGVIEGQTSAELRVVSDSGHLELDMKYDEYVWERGLDLIVKDHFMKHLRYIYNKYGLSELLKELNIQSPDALKPNTNLRRTLCSDKYGRETT